MRGGGHKHAPLPVSPYLPGTVLALRRHMQGHLAGCSIDSSLQVCAKCWHVDLSAFSLAVLDLCSTAKAGGVSAMGMGQWPNTLSSWETMTLHLLSTMVFPASLMLSQLLLMVISAMVVLDINSHQAGLSALALRPKVNALVPWKSFLSFSLSHLGPLMSPFRAFLCSERPCKEIPKCVIPANKMFFDKELWPEQGSEWIQ